jgi:hypothetical protein
MVSNPAYALNYGILEICGGGTSEKTPRVKATWMAVADRDAGDWLGRSGPRGLPWLLASQNELAGADARPCIPGLSGLWREAIVR